MEGCRGLCEISSSCAMTTTTEPRKGFSGFFWAWWVSILPTPAFSGIPGPAAILLLHGFYSAFLKDSSWGKDGASQAAVTPWEWVGCMFSTCWEQKHRGSQVGESWHSGVSRRPWSVGEDTLAKNSQIWNQGRSTMACVSGDYIVRSQGWSFRCAGTESRSFTNEVVSPRLQWGKGSLCISWARRCVVWV